MIRRNSLGTKVLAFLILTLPVSCCNDTWRGEGTIAGRATISGTWNSEIESINIRIIDHCKNEYVVYGVSAGYQSGLDSIRTRLQEGGTITIEWPAESVLTGDATVRLQYRIGNRKLYTSFASRKLRIRRNDSKFVEIDGVL